jgi:PhzF family phenazine biosynthesis protein
MKEVAYKKIDAFTSANSLGNPAACIYLHEDESLSDVEMLAIAQQHKSFVSEMVYCKAESDLTYNLLYYSSECEVDFCGHGTIACMYSLIKESPALLAQPELFIRTRKKGTLTLYNKVMEQDAVYISAPVAKQIGTKLTVGEVATALGIRADQISGQYPLDVIDGGMVTLLVPMRSLADEVQMQPDERTLKQFCLEQGLDIVVVFFMEASNQDHFAHTRVFPPKFGYLEDPATGSGNCAFGYYLQKYNLWQGQAIAIEQGGAGMLYNTVRLMTEDGKVLFGGGATDRIIGTYYL